MQITLCDWRFYLQSMLAAPVKKQLPPQRTLCVTNPSIEVATAMQQIGASLSSFPCDGFPSGCSRRSIKYLGQEIPGCRTELATQLAGDGPEFAFPVQVRMITCSNNPHKSARTPRCARHSARQGTLSVESDTRPAKLCTRSMNHILLLNL